MRTYYTFLSTFLMLSVGTLASAESLRGCWLTHYWYLSKTDTQIQAAAKEMKKGGINKVYIAAYSGQMTFWPSRAFVNAGGKASEVDWMKKLIPLFRAEGLKVGAWFEYGLALGPASHPVAVRNPDWLQRDDTQTAEGNENGGFVFLSPASEPAVRMIVDMVGELADNYDFDDIQIDRFRWTRRTSAGREFGYDPATVEAWRARYHKDPPGDHNDPEWVAFREQLVNRVVERCYKRVKESKPDIVVSTSPVGSYGIRQHMQRWDQWLAGGYIDLVMPQMYMRTLESFKEELAIHKKLAGSKVSKLACGLNGDKTDDWQSTEEKALWAARQGVPGICLWVYHEYTPGIPAIRDELTNFSRKGGVWNANDN